MTWTTPDVINAVSAFFLLIAIVVSLIIGLKSLRQTRNLLNLESVQRELSEIINWATDISACGWVAAEPMVSAKDLDTTFKQNLERIVNEYRCAHARSPYILATSIEFTRLYDDKLEKAVKTTIRSLDSSAEYLDKYLTNEVSWEEVDKHLSALSKSLMKVISQAAAIKFTEQELT